MPSYSTPLRDFQFVLFDVLGAERLAALDGYGEATPDMIESILAEAGKLAEQVIFPLNQSGDKEGCRIEGDAVYTPKGFKEAYDLFCQGGWTALTADPAFGGMGMPHTIGFALNEIFSSANMAFGMYPGLSQGAYDAILHHGTDDQKALYLPKLASGEWSGTMNLTEPQCGTDLGLIKTKAIPNGDGSYAITGNKIYISAGEHDLTTNIVHLVLARLPDAPEGVRGISLFVVPKFLPDSGARNGVKVVSIEHKMGIKGSATCVMAYDGAQGWLVGEAHKGLKAMFTMMNAARLAVAQQGLGMAEVAYQNAVAFAKDRLQMRAVEGTKYPEKPADPIIVHPDVRRMLLTGKAFTEGARALSLWVGMALDESLKAGDADTRQAADDLVALLTPVLKAYNTDMGFDVASLAVQVHGGHGFIWDYGVEQYVRDARIAMLYEGTNGIQALDLVGRKMGLSFGRLLRRFFHPVSDFLETHQEDDDMGEFVLPLMKAFGKLQQATGTIAQKGLKAPIEGAAAATDYLRLFALVAMGYMWARMAKVALQKISDGADSDGFYATKLKTARFFFARLLPEYETRFRLVVAGAPSLMAHGEEEF